MNINNKNIIRFILILGASISCSYSEDLDKSLMQNIREASAINTNSKAFFDTTPQTKPVSYVYSPGILGTEILMGRYCPHFIAQTGERIVWRSGGHIIGQPHSAVTFPEINLLKKLHTKNPVKAIYCELRRDIDPIVQRYFEDTFDFSVEENPLSPETIVRWNFNLDKANLAQDDDIEALHKVYKQHIQKYPKTDIVMFGDSRGAATTFSFIAKYKPQEVKAAILEGIFDSVVHCIKHFIYTGKDSLTEHGMHDLLSAFLGNYKKDGPSPLKFAQTITDDIPLLLVTSIKDGLVPPQGTMSLYNRLKERGFKKVHLLVLKKSIHPCYMISYDEDRTLYETVVHAFYKHYGLPYNAEKATAGQAEFEKTQPNIAHINTEYGLPLCSECYCNIK
jgi:hypothetical protein